MRPAARLVGLSAVLLLGLAGCGSGKVEDAGQRQRLETIRKGTEVYKDPNRALAAGYRPSPRCVESQNDPGAVGAIYEDQRLQKDQKINLTRPELLLYEPQAGEKPAELVGVGYRVPDEGGAPPDSPLGHFDGPYPATGRGEIDRFEIHAWVHRDNPDGPLAVSNPDVRCP